VNSTSRSIKLTVRWAIGAAIVFFVACLILTLHRYYTFYASFDQGIFNQVFWNNLHGRWFESSLSSSLSTNVVHDRQIPEVFYHRLGQHFTPALLLWWPIYFLFPAPITLTVLQVTLVSLAGLVLYRLARDYVEPTIATLITISFYGANAILAPTLSNFHDICQLPLFMFSLLLAMERRWWKAFWVLAVLILLVREDAGISLFGVGVYMVLSRRHPRAGLATCILSFGYMVMLTNLIMPLFSEDISRRFMMERFGQYAEGEEASTLEIIQGILTNPLLLLRELVTPFDRTLFYLIGQWLPLAFVPAVSPPAWAIAGFPLLKLLIGKGQSVLSINIRYAMTVAPGLFYGAILWWSTHSYKFKQDPIALKFGKRSYRLSFRNFWIGCIGLSLIVTLTSNPNRTLSFLIPDSFSPRVYVSLPRQWQHASQIYPLLRQIPPDASVSATTYLVPHLSGRREILRLPDLDVRNDAKQVVRMDYAIADLWQLQTYQSAFDDDRLKLQELLTLIPQLVQTGEYGMVDVRDGVILLQRGVPSNPQAAIAWEAFVQFVQDSSSNEKS
jgi:uncharacterized membrane protein